MKTTGFLGWGYIYQTAISCLVSMIDDVEKIREVRSWRYSSGR